MWNAQTEVTPVTVVVTGSISQSLKQYPSNRPVKHVIKEMQKTALLGTAHWLREVLM